MNTIRLRVTIHLNGNHALNVAQLNSLKPNIERGIAASLPDTLAVDTIAVTRIREAVPRPNVTGDSSDGSTTSAARGMEFNAINE